MELVEYPEIVLIYTGSTGLDTTVVLSGTMSVCQSFIPSEVTVGKTINMINAVK